MGSFILDPTIPPIITPFYSPAPVLIESAPASDLSLTVLPSDSGSGIDGSGSAGENNSIRSSTATTTSKKQSPPRPTKQSAGKRASSKLLAASEQSGKRGRPPGSTSRSKVKATAPLAPSRDLPPSNHSKRARSLPGRLADDEK